MPDIVGTWTLVGIIAFDPDGRPLPPPFGPQPVGRIVFGVNKRLIVAVCDGRSELPAGTVREYAGYCGDYTFSGTVLTTRVDAAPDPALVGTDQVRVARFEGQRLVLRLPPCEIDNVTHHRELTWERISPV